MNFRKSFFITFILLVLFLAIIIVFGYITNLEPYTTQSKITEEFYKNFQTINGVKDYMLQTEYDTISIYSSDYVYKDGSFGEWYIQKKDDISGRKKINNTQIIDNISYLFNERKYCNISLEKNFVIFQIWANLDSGRGVAFSIDGQKPSIDFMTNLIELGKDNWYYYETNVNRDK